MDARYDLVLDESGKLSRAQIKYASRWVNSEAVEVDLRRDSNGTKRTYSKSEIDSLFVYVPQRDVVLRIPMSKVHKRKTITLRFSPPKNNQKNYLDANKFVW